MRALSSLLFDNHIIVRVMAELCEQKGTFRERSLLPVFTLGDFHTPPMQGLIFYLTFLL